jgi:outer membrane protein W
MRGAGVVLFAGAAFLALPSQVEAEKTNGAGKNSVLAGQDSKTKFYVRAGGFHLAPIVNSDNVMLSNVSPFAQLAVKEGPIANSGGTIDSVTAPAAIVGYVLPYLEGRLSLEIVLALPLELDLKVTGAMATDSLAPFALGNVPTGVPALGESLGTAKAIPPVVTAVYRFLPEQAFHPYAGAGLTVMFTYDEQVTNSILTEVSEPTLDVGTGFGVVAQAGIEARIYDRYYATLDIKTILGLSVEAVVHDIYVETPELPLFETAEVGDASVDIGIIPVIVTAAVGADF